MCSLSVDYLTKGPPGWLSGKEPAWPTQVPSLGQEDALEEEMATRSSILAGTVSQTEETGGLQNVSSMRTGALLCSAMILKIRT